MLKTPHTSLFEDQRRALTGRRSLSVWPARSRSGLRWFKYIVEDAGRAESVHFHKDVFLTRRRPPLRPRCLLRVLYRALDGGGRLAAESGRLFLLGLLGVARAALGLAERADGRVAVDLLVARQARLHRRRLLPASRTHFTGHHRYVWDVPGLLCHLCIQENNKDFWHNQRTVLVIY